MNGDFQEIMDETAQKFAQGRLELSARLSAKVFFALFLAFQKRTDCIDL